jgi:hypothetical protein
VEDAGASSDALGVQHLPLGIYRCFGHIVLVEFEHPQHIIVIADIEGMGASDGDVGCGLVLP